MTSKKNTGSALGNNPLGGGLSRGIFNKTDALTPKPPIQAVPSPVEPESAEESSTQIQESSFLNEAEKEKVNLRLPIAINDWLDDLVKKGKRNHGQKIPKEVWVQAALELFQGLPVDWYTVGTVEELRAELKNQEERFKNEE